MNARICTIAEFEAERAAWDRLYRADPAGHVFLSWPWLRAYLGQARGTWSILVLRDDDDLVAAMPVTIQAVPSPVLPVARQLSFLGDPIADYQGMLCRPGREREAVEEFTTALLRLPWDRALLRDVVDARIRDLLARIGADGVAVVQTGTTDCLRTVLPRTWDAYSASLGKNTRGKLNRAMRRLQEFRISSPVDGDIEAHADALVCLNHARWGGSLRTGRATFGRLFCDAYERGCLRMLIAWDGARPIAGIASFVEDVHKTYNLYQLAYDSEYGDFSPGKAIAGLAIRDAIESGYESFDFLRGDERYKSSFARDVVTTFHVRMSRRTIRSAGYAVVYPVYRALKAAAVRVVYGPGRSV